MYRAALGDARKLSQPAYCRQWLPDAILAQAPGGRHRLGWLAARVLLAILTDRGTLPAMMLHPGGKPAFVDTQLPAFSISYSHDAVLVVLSDTGEVGCDVEWMRPRARYADIAQAYFSDAENRWLQAQDESQQTAHFWRLWTAREAILKQSGKSVWDMASVNLAPENLVSHGVYLHYLQTGHVAIACCGMQPFDQAWTLDTVSYF